MKRCPQCQRNYVDETLNFCLEDGARLENNSANDFPTISLPQKSFEESETRHFQVQSEQKSASSPDALPSIAVLPFVNMSNDVENEYFCDGLAEELLNALAKIESLKVAARTSTFFFKGKNTNVSEIGNALNVKTVLEGSVRKAGNRLRITVQLVNTSDGYHLWSERYDRELKDIFDVQDEITAATIQNLKLKLLKSTANGERIPENFEAYNECLKGRHYLNKRTAENILRSVKHFEKALQFDPQYAPAFSGLADSYNLLGAGDYAVLSPDESFPKAKQAAFQALEIDPTLADAHTALG
jgi:adenylate cyclase